MRNQSAPKPNQSNYSEIDIIHAIYGARDGAFTVDMKKVNRIKDLLRSEKARLIDELEAKLPERATEQNKDRLIANWITSHENRLGFNFCLDQVKAILEEAKNG